MKKYLFLSLLLLISINIAASGQLHIMTYNIWNGFDWGKDTKREIAFNKFIRSSNPDVLALQELCGYTQEKLEKQAKKWGHPYAVIIKENGYPVGITSKRPINVKEKLLEGMWHGMLHCETFGIDFFVVHLSPHDYSFRIKEARIITEKIKNIKNKNYIVLGDFNSHSPYDADIDKQKKQLLKAYQRNDKKNQKHNNLLVNEFDYSVISKFLSFPLIDVCQKYITPEEKFSFPTLVFKKEEASIQDYSRKYERIDYILASPNLSRNCIRAKIINNKEAAYLSDHYPLVADFTELVH